MKRSLALSRVYQLLEPGPVVLLTTARGGRSNVMAMSWLTMLEFTPPLVGCVVSNRNFSFAALKATKECVINIPTDDLAAQVVGIGNTSGRDIDKFATFGVTQQKASCVAAPRIAECYANLECRVVDTRMVTAYNFFVLEVVKAWLDRSCTNPRTLHHRGWGTFGITGETITLPSAMP